MLVGIELDKKISQQPWTAQEGAQEDVGKRSALRSWWLACLHVSHTVSSFIKNTSTVEMKLLC